jgi:hypothetical protein
MGSESQSGQSGNPFCFRVRQERSGWHILQPVPSKTTVDLVALVCGAPEFLGMDGDAAPCQAAVVLSERGDASVVVALDEAGGITLVGCPAQLTRGSLTTVAQELLVFTGRLWRMPPEELSAVFEKRLGQSLGDYFSSRNDIGWSESGFRSGLGQSLERGKFPVVLLLTGTNQDVAEAIAHLRSHNLDVKPLGVELYESSGVEIVVPKVLEVAEPGPYGDKEPAKLVPRSTPPQPVAPPRLQPSTADFVGLGVSELVTSSRSAPVKKMPWSDQPAPQSVGTESASAVEAADAGVAVSTPPPEPAPDRKMPWSDQPVPAELKPVVASPQLAPKAAPAAKPVWDGTMPGVMAGRRPPRKSSEGLGMHKGQEQVRNERDLR